MSVADVIAAAHARRARTTTPLRHATTMMPIVQALATLHELLVDLEAELPVFAGASRAVARAGRRLEDALDGERSWELTELVARTIEPDVVACADRVVSSLGPAMQPADGASPHELLEAVAVVVEQELGVALQLCCRLPGFEVPRPWRTPFAPARHQVIERGLGPRDVVVGVERCGRVGAGGRLLEPAHVIVGGGT
jgi:hypothetical protein